MVTAILEGFPPVVFPSAASPMAIAWMQSLLILASVAVPSQCNKTLGTMWLLFGAAWALEEVNETSEVPIMQVIDANTSTLLRTTSLTVAFPFFEACKRTPRQHIYI